MTKTQELNELLSPLVKETGYIPVDVTFEKVGQDWVLTIYIDKEDGDITLEDCEIVNNVVSPFLDEKDPIEQSYLLEVSSPGIDRPLKNENDYLRNINNKIEVKLYAKKNGTKEFVGTLKDYNDGIIILETEEGLIELSQNEISKAAPVVEF